MAYDSLGSAVGTITDWNVNKRHVVKGVVFFMAGALSDIPRLIAAWFGEDVGKKVECSALVIDADKRLWECAVCDEGGFWKQQIYPGNPRAIGSGWQFALTAMDMGADARTAVKMAMKRDMGTGGRIRVHRVADR